MANFERGGRFTLGYHPSQVDEFFARVDDVTAEQARCAAFDLVRGGYQTAPVDDALDQLEDERARLEHEQAHSRLGEGGVAEQLTTDVQALRNRLARMPGNRAVRARAWRQGYDIGDVDALCDRISSYLDSTAALTTAEVRGCVFGVARGSRAYDEAAVDALLDQVVAVMTRAH